MSSARLKVAGTVLGFTAVIAGLTVAGVAAGAEPTKPLQTAPAQDATPKLTTEQMLVMLAQAVGQLRTDLNTLRSQTTGYGGSTFNNHADQIDDLQNEISNLRGDVSSSQRIADCLRRNQLLRIDVPC